MNTKENKHAVVNKCGRPTTYNPKYIEDVYKYMKKDKDEFEEYIKSESTGAQSQSYSKERKVKVNLISKYRFRLYLNEKYNLRIAKSTMQDWESAHDDFRAALDDLKDEQLQRINEGSLSGVYKSDYGKFLASATHGLSEKKETQHSGEINMPQVISFKDIE